MEDAVPFGTLAEVTASLAQLEGPRDLVVERLCQLGRWNVLSALAGQLAPAYPQTLRTLCASAPPAAAEACFRAWGIDPAEPAEEDLVGAAAQGRNLALVLHLLDHGAKLSAHSMEQVAGMAEPALLSRALARGGPVSYSIAGKWLRCATEAGVSPAARQELSEQLVRHATEAGATDLLELGLMAAMWGEPSDLAQVQRLDASLLRQPVQDSGRATSLLVRACANGRLDNVRFCLEHGASADQRSPAVQRPPLVAAAESGNLAIVELLLNSGADPRTAADDGATALGVTSDPTIRARLVQAGCDSLFRECLGESPSTRVS